MSNMGVLAKMLILLSLFLVLACAPKQSPCEMNVNIYGQFVKHKELPVVLVVDSSIADDFYQDILDVAAEINRDRVYFKIARLDIPIGNFKGVNQIYALRNWEDDRKSEQARTAVWWGGSTITETDILVNLDDHNYRQDQYHFKTLMRHEMLHALGMRHQTDDSNGVMYTHLGKNTERFVTEREFKNLECAYGK